MCAPRVASAGPARTSRVPHASLTRSLLSESPWGLASCLLSFNRAERTFREITLYQDTARPRYDDTDTLHYNYKYAVIPRCRIPRYLDPLWRPLGSHWRPVGGLSETSWRPLRDLLRASWALLEHPRALLASPELIWDVLTIAFERSWLAPEDQMDATRPPKPSQRSQKVVPKGPPSE